MGQYKPHVPKAVLAFIDDYFRANAYAPTIREIAVGLGIKSTSTVHYHLKNLERDGLLDSTRYRSRARTLAYNGCCPMCGK